MESNTKAERRKVVVMSRDRLVLAEIALNRFLTAKQIKDKFWPRDKSHNHYGRIRKLVRAGLVEQMTGDNSVALGYRLTMRGIEELPTVELKARAMANRKVSYGTSYEHDRLLHDVRVVLESSNLVSNYRAAHEVKELFAIRHGRQEQKEDGYKVPDGLFVLRNPTRNLTVALELERKQKSEGRYRKILRRLSTSSDFDVVFYLVADPRLGSYLTALLKDVRDNDPVVLAWPRVHGFYFAELGTFLAEGKKAFLLGEGRSFSLESLEEENTRGAPPELALRLAVP